MFSRDSGDAESVGTSGGEESGSASEVDSEENEDKDGTKFLNPWYYVTWCLSLLILCIGITISVLRMSNIVQVPGKWPDSFQKTVWPSNSTGNNTQPTHHTDMDAVKRAYSIIMWYIVCSLMLPIGGYMVMNTDLIVTYFRFKASVRWMKRNNENFENLLIRNAKAIRATDKESRAFEEIEKNFNNSVTRANAHMNEMSMTAQENLGGAAADMVKIYGRDSNRKRIIGKDEIKAAFQDFHAVFSGLVDGWPERQKRLIRIIRGEAVLADAYTKEEDIIDYVGEGKKRRGIVGFKGGHRAYTENEQLRVNCLSSLIKLAVVAPDIRQMEEQAQILLDRELLSRAERWKLEDEEAASSAGRKGWL